MSGYFSGQIPRLPIKKRKKEKGKKTFTCSENNKYPENVQVINNLFLGSMPQLPPSKIAMWMKLQTKITALEL